MMAPVCSHNYKNSDSTRTHRKQCDALGPKVQYRTNNTFYSLFADWVQPGPPLLSDTGWKIGRRTKGFSIYRFMTNHGTENGFWKPFSVYFHQETRDHVTMIHPVCLSHQVIFKHWELLKSIQFPNCRRETERPGSIVTFFRVQWDLLKDVAGLVQPLKGKETVRSINAIPIWGWLKGSLLLKFRLQSSTAGDSISLLALGLKFPSITLSGKTMKSRGILSQR